MPLKTKNSHAQTIPGKVTESGDTSQEVAAKAAKRYGLSPRTLWGIFGEESGFGANLGPSSAGALGPMQFIQGTAEEYGLTWGTSGTVMQVPASMYAAAKYLHALGADTNPESPKTIAALNAYNGNGGGSARTGYATGVLEHGKTYGGHTPLEKGAPGEGAEGEKSEGKTNGNLLEILGDIVTGDIGALGAKLTLASLQILKGVFVGGADLILAPAWHWNQRTVAYYAQFVMDPKTVGDGSEYQYAAPWTIVFWSAGYVLLFTEPGSLRPTNVPGRSRLAKHVRKGQALPAKRQLVKPKDVKRRTPKKPEPVTSRAQVNYIKTYTTTRPRKVQVHGGTEQEATDRNTATGRSFSNTAVANQPQPHGDRRPDTTRNQAQGTERGDRLGRGGDTSIRGVGSHNRRPDKTS
jgi:Transglycosylase SLT domain